MLLAQPNAVIRFCKPVGHHAGSEWVSLCVKGVQVVGVYESQGCHRKSGLALLIARGGVINGPYKALLVHLTASEPTYYEVDTGQQPSGGIISADVQRLLGHCSTPCRNLESSSVTEHFYIVLTG